MEGIGDQGLFIIAALVIAFINWLSATLKKKQASRKEDDPQDAQALQREADEEAQALIDYDSWPSPDDEKRAKKGTHRQTTGDVRHRRTQNPCAHF